MRFNEDFTITLWNLGDNLVEPKSIINYKIRFYNSMNISSNDFITFRKIERFIIECVSTEDRDTWDTSHTYDILQTKKNRHIRYDDGMYTVECIWKRIFREPPNPQFPASWRIQIFYNNKNMKNWYYNQILIQFLICGLILKLSTYERPF